MGIKHELVRSGVESEDTPLYLHLWKTLLNSNNMDASRIIRLDANATKTHILDMSQTNALATQYLHT